MKMLKKVLVLGATGSIGLNTLDVIRHNPDRFILAGATAHHDLSGLSAVTSEFSTKNTLLTSSAPESALLAFIRNADADIVVNGISGSAGLLPSVAALDSGKDLALANKETIVMAGSLIRKLAHDRGQKILPVDSEHSAVFNLINSFGSGNISEIILTASGGPFRTMESSKLAAVTPKDALKHPTWSMGAKITIDSASLANKGLEVIEACRLFDLDPLRVKVVVHPQSLVHSFIRTTDNVLYAQISPPDMRHPILSALAWPEYLPNNLKTLNFDDICSMHFEPPRYADFPLLGLAYRAAGLGASYPIVYNAANEIAVQAFLESKIGFTDLAKITAMILENDWSHEPVDFDDVLTIDCSARTAALQAVSELRT